MLRLDPSAIRWIFVHTAAFDGKAGVEVIRRWHVDERKWSDVGYHYVVRRDGTVESGRSLQFAGAHVEGCNTKSVGICCEGNGDKADHTDAQRAALVKLLQGFVTQFGLTPAAVLGHREVNELVKAGLVGDHYMTDKTCPGTKVDMEQIRNQVAGTVAVGPLPEPEVELVDSSQPDGKAAKPKAASKKRKSSTKTG